MPSRFGPRHCGQSSARPFAATSNSPAPARRAHVHPFLPMLAPFDLTIPTDANMVTVLGGDQPLQVEHVSREGRCRESHHEKQRLTNGGTRGIVPPYQS